MDKAILKKWLEKPHEMGEDALDDLANLLNSYPFSTLLHLMHLKALHNLDHQHYPVFLKKASLHSPDRRHLYTLIHLSDKKKSHPVSSPNGSPEPLPVVPEPLFDPEKELKNLPEAEIQENTSANENTPKSFHDWLKNKGKASEEKKNNQEEELIKKFIETEPRIKPAKAEFYNPVNMARKSVLDNDEIISETLADIFLNQGNLEKALTMFEKLSLKYPEKSAYFAGRIEEVRKKLNE